MPISIPLLRALVAAGATGSAIVDAVEAALAEDKVRAIEQAEAERERLLAGRAAAKHRKRAQRSRDRRNLSNPGNLSAPDVTEVNRDMRDPPQPPPFPPHPPHHPPTPH